MSICNINWLIIIKKHNSIVFFRIKISISGLHVFNIYFCKHSICFIIAFQMIAILHPRWTIRRRSLNIGPSDLLFKCLRPILGFAINSEPCIIMLSAKDFNSFRMLNIFLIEIMWINSHIIRMTELILIIFVFYCFGILLFLVNIRVDSLIENVFFQSDIIILLSYLYVFS